MALKYAFLKRDIAVMIGYVLFLAGYKICWYGVHHDGGIEDLVHMPESSLVKAVEFLKTESWKYLTIIAGLYLASYGTIEFFEFVSQPSIQTGIKTGLVGFTGYILAHEGVNEVPL